MASLLLGLRRQIARNRRKDTYASRYVPKATPIPAVADGKIRIEPENLDNLEPEDDAVQSVTIIQTPSQTKIQSTEEKMEEPRNMEAFGAEEKQFGAQGMNQSAGSAEPFQYEGFEWNPSMTQNEQKESNPETNKTGYQDALLQEVPEQAFREEETLQPVSMFDEPVSSETDPMSELEIHSEAYVSEVQGVFAGVTAAQEVKPEVSAGTEVISEAVTDPITMPLAQEVAQVEELQAPEASMEVESLQEPTPSDFGAYETPEADMTANGVKPFEFEKADMTANGVKPFDFENYKESEPEVDRDPEPVFSETIRESSVGEESKEDFLLKEIDEFRDRAKRLQMLLDNRETEAQKLKDIVDERQEKADALQEKADELDQILQERQQEADGITAQVERQIDSLIEKVSIKMDELEASMADQNEDGRRFSEQKAKELKETLGQIQEQLTTLKTELSDKVHSENVKCFRNISDVLKGTEQKIDSISELEDSVDEKIAPVKLLGISSIVVGVINFVAIIILMIVNMISSGAVG